MSAFDRTFVKSFLDWAYYACFISPRADTWPVPSITLSCYGLGLLGLNFNCSRVFNLFFPALLAPFYGSAFLTFAFSLLFAGCSKFGGCASVTDGRSTGFATFSRDRFVCSFMTRSLMPLRSVNMLTSSCLKSNGFGDLTFFASVVYIYASLGSLTRPAGAFAWTVRASGIGDPSEI